MIFAGIGCRKGTSAASIEAAIDAALAECGLARASLHGLATHVTKCDEPGLIEVARQWRLSLTSFSTDEMATVSEAVETVSDRVVELKGVPSVAEAAALAAAGKGARLIARRLTTRDAACAIAEGEGRPGQGEAAP